jgi:adenylate kinase
MAPIGDGTVQQLHDLVNKLEQRVQELESRLAGGPKNSPESVRMILMGPPGAGMYSFLHLSPIGL